MDRGGYFLPALLLAAAACSAPLVPSGEAKPAAGKTSSDAPSHSTYLILLIPRKRAGEPVESWLPGLESAFQANPLHADEIDLLLTRPDHFAVWGCGSTTASVGAGGSGPLPEICSLWPRRADLATLATCTPFGSPRTAARFACPLEGGAGGGAGAGGAAVPLGRLIVQVFRWGFAYLVGLELPETIPPSPHTVPIGDTAPVVHTHPALASLMAHRLEYELRVPQSIEKHGVLYGEGPENCGGLGELCCDPESQDEAVGQAAPFPVEESLLECFPGTKKSQIHVPPEGVQHHVGLTAPVFLPKRAMLLQLVRAATPDIYIVEWPLGGPMVRGLASADDPMASAEISSPVEGPLLDKDGRTVDSVCFCEDD